jgi:hypothetical protein
MISNAAISRVLRQIAYLIELEEGAQDNNDNDNDNNKNKPNIVFKIRAYRRTADIIENLSSNVEEIYNKWKLKGLIEIPSVGKAIPCIPPLAPNILDMTLGRFFIRSSGEVNGIASPLLPKGLCG